MAGLRRPQRPSVRGPRDRPRLARDARAIGAVWTFVAKKTLVGLAPLGSAERETGGTTDVNDPAEVEAALEEHPSVASAAVVAKPDDDLGNVPHAFVFAKDVTDDELLDHLRTRLAAYKLPRGFTRVMEPLRDEAGKVRRSGLRKRLLT